MERRGEGGKRKPEGREGGGTAGEGRGRRGTWKGREGGSAEDREGGRGAGRAWSGRRHGRGGSLPRPPGWRGRPRPTTPHRALTVWIFLKPNTYEGSQRLLCLRGLSTQALRHPALLWHPAVPTIAQHHGSAPARGQPPCTTMSPRHDQATPAAPRLPSSPTITQRCTETPSRRPRNSNTLAPPPPRRRHRLPPRPKYRVKGVHCPPKKQLHRQRGETLEGRHVISVIAIAN